MASDIWGKVFLAWQISPVIKVGYEQRKSLWMFQGNVKVELVKIVTPEDVEIGIRFLSWVPAKGHLPCADAHAIVDAFN